jgi:hypothetical protein
MRSDNNTRNNGPCEFSHFGVFVHDAKCDPGLDTNRHGLTPCIIDFACESLGIEVSWLASTGR